MVIAKSWLFGLLIRLEAIIAGRLHCEWLAVCPAPGLSQVRRAPWHCQSVLSVGAPFTSRSQ
eukprot:1109009-Pelagomonas_calceolata.AAC.1